ncbi:hypothetical protein ACX27O_22820 [Micromonospora sp. SD19]|uniref:hypothetical protein n=1 Tax=Micromonospora parva TaxID=1464048 RepID=UPI0033D97767
MDATLGDRLRSVVLFGAAAAVLVVGGWWWHAAEPSSTAGAAATPSAAPRAEQSVSTPLERAMAGAEPDERVTVRLDPDSGEITRGRNGAWAVLDPATGSPTETEGGPAVLSPAGELPQFHETIWREERELAPGQEVTRQAGNGADRYLLQYRCTRLGTMVVTSAGARIAGESRIDCDGTIATAEVLSENGSFLVSLSAVDRPIDIEVRLVALPR